MFLKKRHQMTEMRLPAKADTERQKGYFMSTLEPLMEKAKSGDIALLFLDASHFVMGCDFLGHIYGRADGSSGHFPAVGTIMCSVPWIMFPRKSTQLPMTLL